MARVLAFVPDLLFGSSVMGQLQAAGHDAVLVGDAPALKAALPADAVVVDLTLDSALRLDQLHNALAGAPVPPRTLAFYSHVEVDVRRQAEAAGLDQVVPRSRMAREGAALIERLLSG